jgi:PhnB protein
MSAADFDPLTIHVDHDCDLGEVVAQLAIGDSLFWVEDESPPHGNFSPESVGGATARMLLIVDDPESVLDQAVAAGAAEINPVDEEHGWRLGRIEDPFGHRWEIGKPMSDWPPAGSHLRRDEHACWKRWPIPPVREIQLGGRRNILCGL